MSGNDDQEKSLAEDEYLSTEQLTELRDLLQTQASSLMEKSRDAVQDLTDVREQDPDALDLAVNESNREFNLRLADRDRRLLKKIQHALKCIEEGTYGACESCGGEIAFRRLLARPVARMCIDCKTETEQLERRSNLWS